jgi:hypothetical protein
VGAGVIGSAQLDAWLHGLDAADAGRALLAAGAHPDELGRAAATARLGRQIAPILAWTLTEAEFRHRSRAPARELAPLIPDGLRCRLAVSTHAVPTHVVARLLDASEVASAFVAVDRPPAARRRRPWHWPFAIGLVGFDEARAASLHREVARPRTFPPRLLAVRRLDDEPGSVDLLLIDATLRDAVEQVGRLKPTANAVVVLGRPLEAWPVVEARLATLRAMTSAVASGVAAPLRPADLVRSLVYESSRALPFDVTLTIAARGALVLCAEPDAMQEAALPAATVRAGRELRRARAVVGATFPARIEEAARELEVAARGGFAGETHEASTIAEANRRIDTALDEAVEERWCQAYVGADNVVRPGRNVVSVFIGPPEHGALAAPAVLDEASLPWEEEDAQAFRLTIVFVPFEPRGEPQQREVDLPRFGRSRDARFDLDAPADAPMSARIVVLFRNRVLQTAVLTGRVGEPARLAEVAAIVGSLTALDDRRAFDVSLMANHTGTAASLIRHSDGHTFVSAMPGLPPIADRIADKLADATRQSSTKRGLRTPRVRRLLVELAQIGRGLYSLLERELGPLDQAGRIQLVTARGQWFLPIEIAYTRYAPHDDASICERYLQDPATCDGACTPLDDRTSVCPNAFWGLSKTIERLHFDPGLPEAVTQGYLLLARAPPRSGRRDVVVRRILFGASERVTASAREATVAALGPGATAVSSWREWEAELKAADTQLLVLLPHTDYREVLLEIRSDGLPRDHIERDHVTGKRKVSPIVLLFGCRTTGQADDPAGFATIFLVKGARAVFHSSTDLLNVHATALAQRLVGRITQPGRAPQLLSEALADFRREAVHDGLVAAFAIAAYGDADWRV